jgi:hypothetical protein
MDNGHLTAVRQVHHEGLKRLRIVRVAEAVNGHAENLFGREQL